MGYAKPAGYVWRADMCLLGNTTRRCTTIPQGPDKRTPTELGHTGIHTPTLTPPSAAHSATHADTAPSTILPPRRPRYVRGRLSGRHQGITAGGMWVGYPSVCWVVRLDTSEVSGILGGYFGVGTPQYAAGAPHTPSPSYLISTYRIGTKK